jgi:cytochrome P450
VALYIIQTRATNGLVSLDTIGRAAFSYDFNCLSGDPHPLADALDGLTNNENSLASFYMRALFWIFPSILSIGKKGEMIRKAQKELGEIALRMWKDAKVAGDRNGTALMSLMCEWNSRLLTKAERFCLFLIHAVKAHADSGQQMSEEHAVDQMRTIISAGYETVSATVAVRFSMTHAPSVY